MAPRRGGSGGGRDGFSFDTDVNDTPMRSMFFDLYAKSDVYGQLAVNAIFAALLLVVFFLNRRPAAKLVHVAAFCFFAACAMQCVRWGLVGGLNWVPRGYRYESSVVVLLQRVGWPVLLVALLRAMRPGKILGAGPWLGVLVLGVLNLAYVVYDFLITSSSLKNLNEYDPFEGAKNNDFFLDWVKHIGWLLGDRDFSLLWTKDMVRRFTDQPEYVSDATWWSLDAVVHYRMERLYTPKGSTEFEQRDTQIKLGLAADVLALVLVVVIGGLHIVTWHRQGKAELPRRRSFLAIAIGGLLLSTLFRIIISAHWMLPNWAIITNLQLWDDWLAYFPDTDEAEDMVRMPSYWLDGYRTTVDGYPVLQVVFEQIGPVVACLFIVLSMAAERRSRRTVQQFKVAR
ncbi:hypothetical protein CC79DRAFT_1371626 [Sarocladium strictum]